MSVRARGGVAWQPVDACGAGEDPVQEREQLVDCAVTEPAFGDLLFAPVVDVVGGDPVDVTLAESRE